jgi:hypothetical protein
MLTFISTFAPAVSNGLSAATRAATYVQHCVTWGPMCPANPDRQLAGERSLCSSSHT